MVTTTDSVLRRGVAVDGDEIRLTLDPGFQGLPDTAHGGSVLAAFQALAGVAGPQVLHGLYRRRVPLGTPLRVTLAPGDGGVTCRLLDGTDAVLVEGAVRAAATAADTIESGEGPGDPLPISSTCFACGVDNPLGLRARLFVDDVSVSARWRPRQTVACADGSLAPIALITLLDEAAFWLGALASGESGMTTELTVTLHERVAFGAPIRVRGARSATRQRADDPRSWDTDIVAADDAGRVVASGRITFVAVRGAARRLVAGLLAMNPPEMLRRVFPAYGVRL